MRIHEFERFPRSALRRYTELLLRRIYQFGGRERYVRVADLEDALGLEEELILHLCRTRLLGEVHVADRVPAELADAMEYSSPLERHCVGACFSEAHVRIRPGAVRLTAKELLRKRRKKNRQ